jgi:hypothetical protein
VYTYIYIYRIYDNGHLGADPIMCNSPNAINHPQYHHRWFKPSPNGGFTGSNGSYEALVFFFTNKRATIWVNHLSGAFFFPIEIATGSG